MKKKVYLFVVYNADDILSEGSVLAKDENHARLLIPGCIDDPDLDLAGDDIKVDVRPFC